MGPAVRLGRRVFSLDESHGSAARRAGNGKTSYSGDKSVCKYPQTFQANGHSWLESIQSGLGKPHFMACLINGRSTLFANADLLISCG
jgi:hypothetical protein